MNFKRLAEPFAANEIEWRIWQAGQNARGIYAKVLAYITNRAIMERFDEVCGPANWKNEFRYEQGGAVLCGLSVRIDGEWVAKWDGAENTDIEAVKGGLSNSMKRAAVQWGIGRYLYDLEEGWAIIGEDGPHYCPAKPDNGNKKGYPAFRWAPPKLPAWALPSPVGGETVAPLAAAKKAAKPVEDLNIMPTGPFLGHPLAEVPVAELKALADHCRKKDAKKYAARIIALDDEINRRADSARDNGDLHPALATVGADTLPFRS